MRLDVVSSLDSGLARGVTIGTHDGTFHCDECLAVGLLRMVPLFASATVLRTRDPSLLEKCDVVVDVGGVYDSASKRFDHHQRGFEETMEKKRTKLSSAGLVYKHYGLEVVKDQVLFDRIYSSFIEHIDGIDNGQEAFYSADGNSAEKAYEVSTTLSSRVGRLNPRWNEKGVDINERFKEAVELCSKEFVDHLTEAKESWLPAREIVAKAVGGPVVVLETYCPWQAHLFALEKNDAESKYVMYEDSKGGWRVQAVPIREGSFTSRLPLPEPWRGLRDDTLSNLVGIPGCIFVHATGFIAGAKTYDAALQLAQKALEQ